MSDEVEQAISDIARKYGDENWSFELRASIYDLLATSSTLIEEQAARIAELEQKLRTTSMEALAISDTNNELAARVVELEAEIERMTPKFVAYEYLESPAGREIAEARLSEAVKVLEPWATIADAVLAEAPINAQKVKIFVSQGDIGHFVSLDNCRAISSFIATLGEK